MSLLPKSREELYDATFRFALLGICITLPFNTVSLNSAFIILLVVSWLLMGRWKERVALVKNNYLLLAFFLFYLLHIVFLINTQNIKNGTFELEKKLSLLIMPLVFLSTPPLKEETKRLALMSFSLSCLAMILYSLFQIANYHFQDGTPLLYKDHSYDYREYFVQVAERHPTYTSMYLLFSCICLYTFISNKHIPKLVVTGIISFFVLIIFLLSSRLIILGTSLLFIAYFSAQYFQNKVKSVLAYAAYGIAVLFVSIVVIWSVPSIKSRLVEEFLDAYTFAPARGIHYNSLNTRISEVICGTDIIVKNPLWGVGTGDVQDELNACYEAKAYSPVLYQESYNPHNQFVHTFAGLGIAGITVLCFLLFLLFRAIDVSQNLPYNYVVCISFLLFFTETFFGFQKGIVFFSLFTPLLYVKKL